MTKLGVLFSVLGVGAGCIPAFAQKQLPNIIVMLSDDQGWGDLGFTGNTFVQTPNIDRIAHEGTILENFLCLSGVIPDEGGVLDRTLSCTEWR